ncbi:akirin-2-like [Apostichopus japonicus]|uniref:akirin-2-like n=1 Tax=Stichopus japonicus TaxID=307972 RepID=UPI003AB567AE
MACATMKRSLDFDPLHSPGGSPKRRRCLTNVSPSTSSHIGCRQTSPFTSVTPKISPSQLAQNICQEWKRIKRRKRLEESFPEDVASHSSVTSQMLYPSFTPQTSSLATFNPAVGFPASSSFNFTSSASHHQSADEEAACSSRGKEQPLFTLSQVIMICERMLKEQESRMKEEYDKVLSCKLAEQYDSFVRFNQDQMRRRFGDNAASYVS